MVSDLAHDRRRRQWQPVSTTLPHDKNGEGLKRKFGRDGLLVWMLFLLACKRSPTQGEFEYAGEADGWHRLGLGYPHTPANLTLTDFFAYTGRMKLTSRRRDGELVKVSCTRFGEWTNAGGRAVEAEEKSRKRAQNTRTKRGRYPDETKPDSDSDSDSDSTAVGIDGEKLHELYRVLAAVRGADDRTIRVLAPLAMRLPLSVLADVRERCAGKGAGWVVNALRAELEERAA